MSNYCRNDVEDNEIALKWESISSDGAGYLPLYVLTWVEWGQKAKTKTAKNSKNIVRMRSYGTTSTTPDFKTICGGRKIRNWNVVHEVVDVSTGGWEAKHLRLFSSRSLGVEFPSILWFHSTGDKPNRDSVTAWEYHVIANYIKHFSTWQ